MSLSINSNSRVSIKLKPRAPVRSSLASNATGEATTNGSSSITNNANANANSSSVTKANPFAEAAAVLNLRGTPATGVSGVSQNTNGSSNLPLAQISTPETIAKNSPFWQTALGMVDIVLNPARLALVLEKEALEDEQNSNDTPNTDYTSNASVVVLATERADRLSLLNTKYAYSCEEVCTAVRCICDLGASEALFKELHARLSAYISSEVSSLVASLAQTTEEKEKAKEVPVLPVELRALSDVVKLWSAVIRNVVEISTVFMYLDRRYVLQETREGSIFNVSVNLFKGEIMYRGRSVTALANKGFLKLLEEDRMIEKKNSKKLSKHIKTHQQSGSNNNSTNAGNKTIERVDHHHHHHQISAQHLTRYRDLTLAVQLYFSELEPLILNHSHEVYNEMGKTLLMGEDEEEEENETAAAADNDNAVPTPSSSTLSVGNSNAKQASESDDEDDGMASARTFFAGAERLIQSEHRRIAKYLDPRSRPKLDEALQLRLVKPFAPELFEKDFAQLVAKGRLSDIARGFQLLCLRHVNEKDKAKATFAAFVKKWASKFVADIDIEDDDVFIPNIIALDDACQKIIDAAFTPGYDEEFQAAKTSSFEAALGNKEQRVAQLLVKFMDGFLRVNTNSAVAVSSSSLQPSSSSSPNGVGCRTKPTVVVIGSNKSPSSIASTTNKNAPCRLYAASSPVVASPLSKTAGGGFPSVLPQAEDIEGPDADAANKRKESPVEKEKKKNEEETQEEDVTIPLDKALRIFIYMPSKDIFEAFYLREYSNRVLTRRSASTVTERYVIAKLRGICGSHLTKQLEGMLRDLESSVVQSEVFRRTIIDRENGRMDDYGVLLLENADANHKNNNKAAGNNNNDVAHSSGAKGGRKVEDANGKPVAAPAAASTSTTTPASPERERKLLPPCPKTTSPEGALLLHTTISTLTQSYWPFFETFLPSESYFPKMCAVVMRQFEAFYDSQFRQRKLTWVHSVALCTVRANYLMASSTSPQRIAKDFHGSFLQGLILSVCFPQTVASASAETEITFGEILKRICQVDHATGAPMATSVGISSSPSAVILTKVQQSEASASIQGTKLTAKQFIVRQLLVCALLGLLTGKVPILLRSDSSSSLPASASSPPPPASLNSAAELFSTEIKDTDVFRVNTAFSSKQRIIRLPQILPKDNSSRHRNGAGGKGGSGAGGIGPNDEALLKKIESQRQYLLDATIAKIIKARNSCSHTELVGEVLKVVAGRFTTDGAAVKLRIEELLKRSFIERDAKDPTIYRFVA